MDDNKTEVLSIQQELSNPLKQAEYTEATLM